MVGYLSWSGWEWNGSDDGYGGDGALYLFLSVPSFPLDPCWLGLVPGGR